MSTYVVGDVQGCYDELQQLLLAIAFDLKHDTLWFTGDLVNRGSQSLEVLRFVKQLGTKAITVLGNHDLHLLAIYQQAATLNSEDTLDSVLSAPDYTELCQWLMQQPLLHHDSHSGYTLVHAGIYPLWTLQQAQQYADEVTRAMNGYECHAFFRHMYGNIPNKWHDTLEGYDRLRFIINTFTRMRYCTQDGIIDLSYKGSVTHTKASYLPWFEVNQRMNKDVKIIFGHWASLGDAFIKPNLYFLDSGCVWGNKLTALRLEDQTLFSVASRQRK